VGALAVAGKDRNLVVARRFANAHHLGAIHRH
jgi:hypothetical protein